MRIFLQRCLLVMALISLFAHALASQEFPLIKERYTAADLREPHDRVENAIHTADTIVLVSFFNTGRAAVPTHCFMMRDHSTGQIVYSPGAIHGTLPSGRNIGKIPPGSPPLLEYLKRLPPVRAIETMKMRRL